MLKKFAISFGWVFAVIGVMGYMGTALFGAGPGALFRVDTAMSVIHVLSGAWLLYVAYKKVEKAGNTLRIIGILFLIISVGGFFAQDSILDLVNTNTRTDYFHLALALVVLWASSAKKVPTAPLPMGTM